MKYKRLLTLALAAALCIVAAACGTKNNEPDTPTKTDTPTAAPGGTQTVGDTGDGTVREDGSYVPGQVNRLRLTYNGNVSSALYVTSAAQLPDYPELSAYDDAFFKDHALVLVQESVNSGSVEVGIESVSLKDDHTAVVTLIPSGPRRGAGRHRRPWPHGCCGRRWTPDWRITSGRWPIRRWSPSCLSIDKAIPNPRLPRRRGFSAHFPAVPTGKCGGDSV